ncbi:unnamed protein product [Ectocarpus sp. CCAP 1310/34]|nr:unnamed protein product [Ectocarpus sp. CCAP 1310/34]
MAEGADAVSAASATATIAVKFTSSDKAAGQVSISLEGTVGELKEAIRSQFDVEPKRIIFQGRILNKDDQTLQDCKLKDGLTVVVQVLAAGASASPSPAAATAPAAAAVAAAPATPNPAAGLAAATQSMSGFGLGAVSSSPVGQAVATVSRQPAAVARECLTTLTKVIDNIKAHPTEEKYRKIKRANAGFSRKVGAVPGGEACMRALGFVEHGDAQESWLLAPSEAAWNVLTDGRVDIQRALAILPGAPAAAGASTGGFAGGLGVLPPPGAFPQAGLGGGMGGGMPDMATMARMARNPAVMQGMMNDPSVQAMMRSSPQMAAAMQSVMARPGGLAQAFEAIQNNPAMAQMAQQMMQDPTALQRASQMDFGGALAAGINAAPANAAQGFQAPSAGGQGGAPAAPSPAAGAAPSPPPAAAPAAAGGGEAGEEGKEMTEDELIAEAIRRSMED